METTVSVSFQERAFKILCQLPGNVICADCNAPSPDWASVTLGVFVCHKCSGVHRSIGLHISRIKSTKLDSWSLKHMYMITYANNDEANTYWEAYLPDNRPSPNEHTSTEDLTAYIYDKYVHKKFIDPQGKPPLDIIVEKLNLGADKEESESKESYFQRKLEELEEILKTKALEIPDPKKANQPAPESPKDPLHNRLKALRDQKLHRMGSNPNPQLLPSNSIEGAKKHTKKRPVGGSSELKEDLFEGLTLKAASTTPKQADSGRDSSESPDIKKKRNPVSFSSKERPFNLFVDSPPKSQHAYHKSVIGTVENERENSSDQDDVVILDKSQNRSPSNAGDEGGYADRNPHEQQQGRNKSSPKKNVQKTHEEPFFLNATSQDMAKHGTHLKRPSQEFERFKIEEPVPGQKNRLSPHNRIRPSDPYPWWIVLAGSCLLHMGFGYMYSWGSTSAYFAIFLRDENEGKVHYMNVASYSALIFLGLSIGYSYPEKMVNWFGFRKSVFFSMFAAFLMLSVCSLTIMPFFYAVIPTLFTGFFIGLVYNIPFYCTLQYFTESGANLKSLFYIFDGLGAVFFGYTSYLILDADQSDVDYLDEVAYNLPMVVLSSGTKLLIIGTIGSITLKPKFNFVEKNWSALKDKEQILLHSDGSLRDRKRTQKIEIRDVKSAITSPAFRSLLQITVTSSLLGSYYLYGYKSVGLELNYTDHFLTIAGGCGMLVMCIGRAAAVLFLRIGTFKMYIKWVFAVQVLLGCLAAVCYNIFLLYFLPIMFMYGFLHTMIKEEVRSNYIEEIECSMTACAMLCFTLANLIGFAIIKLGEFYMSHATLNLILVAPIVWALYAEMKYERETYTKRSADESEMTKMLGY